MAVFKYRVRIECRLEIEDWRENDLLQVVATILLQDKKAAV